MHDRLLAKSYLKRKVEAFPVAAAILESELAHPDHAPGQVNLERLMTRLSGGMPYDYSLGTSRELGFLLSELKRAFAELLREARSSAPTSQADLRLFAGHLLWNRCNCITFNYDDLLDEALWRSYPTGAHYSWSPDWGYGFPSKASEELAHGYNLIESGPMTLLKLHGSLNWRVPLGTPKPYGVHAIRHHESWFEHPHSKKTPLDKLEPYLSDEPFTIPPVLTKTEMVEQPVLQVVWRLALEKLRQAEQVVFIGYSLPFTDIAALFLFREGLGHLSASQVTIVDHADNAGNAAEKAHALLSSYQRVFPDLGEDRLSLAGATSWISNNLVEWFFNSKGEPIAYCGLQKVFNRDGGFVGNLAKYSPTKEWEMWFRNYRGEIWSGNRLVFREGKWPPDKDHGGSRPAHNWTIPDFPDPTGKVPLPPQFRDLQPSELAAIPT